MQSSFRITVLACLQLIAAVSFSQTVAQVFSYPSNAPGPVSTPVQGRDGNLYTTTSGDGTTHTNGAIFQTPLARKGTRLWNTFTTANGTNPESGLTLGLDGNYYGAAPGGGAWATEFYFRFHPLEFIRSSTSLQEELMAVLPFRHRSKPQMEIYTATQVLAA